MNRLDSLDCTPLNAISLDIINIFQLENKTKQGVYVVHYQNKPVYVGKANNILERLGEHFEKLSGRRNVNLDEVGYKAVFLDKSMSTAANETILIEMFQEVYSNMWNGAGFGPKDPGKERDTTRPGAFDIAYPIIDTFPIALPINSGAIKLKELLKIAKSQLPYVFRFGPVGSDGEKYISFSQPEISARKLLQESVNLLGEGWHGAVLSYGMVMYKKNKEYEQADVLLPLTGEPAARIEAETALQDLITANLHHG
jgi:hypothetical protein